MRPFFVSVFNAGTNKTPRPERAESSQNIMKTQILRMLPFACALPGLWLFSLTTHANAQEGAPKVIAMSAGDTHSLFVTSDGKLWAVGNNEYGQLADGTTTNRLTPTQVTSLGAVSVDTVAAGYGHTLVATSDGKLWAVGLNDYGQLGDGTTINRGAPVQVTAHGAASVDAVAAAPGRNTYASGHSLYVTDDGKLYAMGHSLYGQLGNGYYGSPWIQSTPARVSTPSTASVVAVAAGAGGHSLYVTDDGKLWAMGNNESGQLGDGTINSRYTPVQVTAHGAISVVAVAAGAAHSLYVTSDGNLWATGDNRYGQLGNGSTISRSTPARVTAHGAAAVIAVAAGSTYSLYVTDDGNLWAMGSNFGATPVQVKDYAGAPVTNVIAVAAGVAHSFYVTSDGELWGIGSNASGQLGDGTTIDRATPVRINIPFAPVFATGGNLPETSLAAGDSVTLGVNVNGYPAPTLQWQVSASNGASWQDIDGAVSSTLSLAGLLYSDNGKQYRVVASNSQGTVYSATTTLAGIPLAWLENYGSQTRQAGQTATFKANAATAADSAACTFAWKKNGTVIPDAPNAATYTTPALIASDNGATFSVTVIVTVAAPGVTDTIADTIEASLAVTFAPAFTNGGNLPEASLVVGGSVLLGVSVTGNPPPTFQWQVSADNGASWTNIPGATSSTLTLTALTDADNGKQYRVAVSNNQETIYSDATTLTNTPLAWANGYGSQTKQTGQTATFKALVAADAATCAFVWKKNGAVISNAPNAATYTTPALTTADNGSMFSVTVTGPGISGTLEAALAVTPAHTMPGFTTSGNLPLTTNAQGDSATLNVTITGYPAPTLQWQVSANNGATWTNIPDATTATLSLTGLTDADNGKQYRVQLTNSVGTTNSNATMLLVQSAPPYTPRLDVNKITLSLAQPALATSTFAITSNIAWTAQIKPATSGTWLAVTPVTGAGDYPNATVTTLSKNTGDATRTAYVVVSGSGGDNTLTRTLIATQAATNSGAGPAPTGAALPTGATLTLTVTDTTAPGNPQTTRTYTVAADNQLTTTDAHGPLTLAYEYTAAGATATLVIPDLDSVYSLQFTDTTTGMLTLYTFDADGPYELDGTFNYTPPAATTYALTVTNGTGSGSYAANVTVNITAPATNSAGQIFDHWMTTNGGTFANANSATTTFTMPAANTTITAIYKDSGGNGGNNNGGTGGNSGGSGGGGGGGAPSLFYLAAAAALLALRAKRR